MVSMITIWVHAANPPAGLITCADGTPPEPFSGWLQLLAILNRGVGGGPGLTQAEEPRPRGPAGMSDQF